MTERKLSQALWALPLVSILLIAFQASAVLLVISLTLEPWLIALILILVPIALTGALHWDGLADVFDGLGVGAARRADVMRDPNLGTFGALALLFVFAAQFFAYEGIVDAGIFGGKGVNPFAWLPIAFCALFVSRAVMGLAWALVPPMDAGSQAARLGQPSPWPQAAYLVGGLALSFAAGFGIMSLLIFLVLIAGWVLFIRRVLGGVNGDGLGAIQLTAETLILLIYAGSL